MPGAQWFPGAHLNYAQHALRYERPNADALMYLSERAPLSRMSWEDLGGKVRILATQLRKLGVEPGDRVVASTGAAMGASYGGRPHHYLQRRMRSVHRGPMAAGRRWHTVGAVNAVQPRPPLRGSRRKVGSAWRLKISTTGSRFISMITRHASATSFASHGRISVKPGIARSEASCSTG